MKNMFLGVFLTAFFCLSHAGVISYSYQAKLNPDSIEEHSHQVLEAFEGFLDAPHIEKAATIFKNNNFNRAITYQCLIGIGFFNNHNSFGKLRFQQKIEAISDYTNFLSTIASPYELFFKENKAHDQLFP
ncbi:hypothetical protein [Endozoicomonas sp. Mp262]|uniref:hypothetical protein n=1 Tax=Endozoicomonas sp. Mp262 TaxID=2919499 RepID=UPI0021DAFE2C